MRTGRIADFAHKSRKTMGLTQERFAICSSPRLRLSMIRSRKQLYCEED